jgi:transposase-like protein
MAGAPTKYDPKFKDKAYKLCLLGATDIDLADFFDVCEATINNWKIDYPEFLESIKKGKIEADSNVADRLYQRALGFEHDSEEIKIVDGEVIRVPIRKVYAPDPTSAIFWLKNRQSDKWRDKTENKIEFDRPIFTGINLDVPENNSAGEDSIT